MPKNVSCLVTKIIRKPEPVGCEMKAVACGVTGCILGVEIVEDEFAIRWKRFSTNYEGGTTIVLRLGGVHHRKRRQSLSYYLA